MYALVYLIAFIFGVAILDHYARKAADKELFARLDADMKRVFGRIEPPISLELARHEAEMEAINGIMCEEE